MQLNEDFFDKIGSIRKGAVKIDFPQELIKPETSEDRQTLIDYSERIKQEGELQNIRYKFD